MARSTPRALLTFVLAFSLIALQASMSSNHSPITVPPVRANPAPTEYWYPSGPAMDYVRDVTFVDQGSEFANLESTVGQSIDLTDAPLYANLVSSFDNSGFFLARPTDGVVSGIDFNLANDFWGINMTFGNDVNGIQIRQGIAHLIDKALLISNEGIVAGYGLAVDNPSGANLPTPNPCTWDTLFPESLGCTVGPTSNNPPGGAAYNCNYGAACPTGTVISGTNYPWQPAIGSPNFCAAATHFQTAFNSVIPGGGVKLNTNCVLLPPGSKTPDTTGNVWARDVPFWTGVDLFIRNDNIALYHLGLSVAQEICALFTGSFSNGCGAFTPILSVSFGGFDAFSGYVSTVSGQPNLSWWIYTSGAANAHWLDDFTDTVGHLSVGTTPSGGWTANSASWSEILQDQYLNYASSLAQPRTFNHTPCASTVPTYTPSNYGSLCNPAYDNVTNALVSSPCFSASGDPAPGQITPTFANCSGGSVSGPCTSTTACTAVSAGYQAEDNFGRAEYAIPVLVSNPPYAYLSNWQRVVKGQSGGIFNYFTWFNAYSPNPAALSEYTSSLTIRQGFSQPPVYLNPYSAESPWDLAIVRSIYDSLEATNPVQLSDGIGWMTADPNGPTEFPCSGGVCSGIGYSQTCNATASNQPCIPSGTVDNFRFTLRGDLFWQDASKHAATGFVSAWDVKFSYATLDAKGSFLGSVLKPMVCNIVATCTDGITVSGPRQFDIHLNQKGAATLGLISSIPILPGRYWTDSSCATIVWDGYVSSGSVPDGCMTPNPNMVSPTYDPTCNDKAVCPTNPAPGGTFIGSGAWTCTDSFHTSGPLVGALGGGCTSTDTQNPPYGGVITLNRFGYNTGAPGAAIGNRIYFRSSSNAAKWIWSNDNGGPNDSGNLVAVLACQNAPVAPLGPIYDPNLGYPNGCGHWQQGIGNCCGTTGHPVGSAQVVIVQSYLGVRWVAPEDWTGTFGTVPVGIAIFPPVLYEGSYVSGSTTIRPTLNPARVGGCTNTFDPSSPTSGGYDC